MADGRWNPFGTRLVAPELVTPKTVADDGLDPALAGRRAGNDPGTLAGFEGVRRESARSVQDVAEFVAAGEVFEWLGRPVTLATGAQYRELDYRFRPDPLNAAGLGPQQIREFPKAADQRVWAVFAEGLAYVGDRAELQLAARHERYDRAGSSTDPKVSGQFLVSDWLSVRASWGTSFQAPSVFQAAGNTSSRTLTDPFRFDGQGGGPVHRRRRRHHRGPRRQLRRRHGAARRRPGPPERALDQRRAAADALRPGGGQRGLLDAPLPRRHRPGAELPGDRGRRLPRQRPGPTTGGWRATRRGSSAW